MANPRIQSSPGSAFGWIIGIIALILLLWWVLGWGWGDGDGARAPSVDVPIADEAVTSRADAHPSM